MRGAVLLLLLCSACGAGMGSGSKWIAQPLDDDSSGGIHEPAIAELEGAPATRPSARTIGGSGERLDRSGGGGRPLGTFRNTYYDFPTEGDFSGPSLSLMSASCQPIAQVPRAFYEALCVQGSGALKSGGTVSFSKRDCACAEVCPRNGQKICFDALDKGAFPYGRGASGSAISPMRTVAADTSVLPMGTVIYIPELDGAPRGENGETTDGCFVVEDRGLRVKGEHVDIFTGAASQTQLLNDRVPSNQGVTVVVDAPKCGRLVSKPR